MVNNFKQKENRQFLKGIWRSVTSLIFVALLGSSGVYCGEIHDPANFVTLFDLLPGLTKTDWQYLLLGVDNDGSSEFYRNGFSVPGQRAQRKLLTQTELLLSSHPTADSPLILSAHEYLKKSILSGHVLVGFAPDLQEDETLGFFQPIMKKRPFHIIGIDPYLGFLNKNLHMTQDQYIAQHKTYDGSPAGVFLGIQYHEVTHLHHADDFFALSKAKKLSLARTLRLYPKTLNAADEFEAQYVGKMATYPETPDVINRARSREDVGVLYGDLDFATIDTPPKETMNKVIEDYIKGKKPRKSKDPGLSVPIRRMVRNSFRFGAGVTGALSATAIKSAIFGDLDFVADEVLTHRMYLRHFARNSLATARSFCSGGAGIVGGIGAFGITSLVAANVYWTNSDPRNSYRGLDEVMIGPGEPVLNRRRFSTISCHNMRLR